jgi:hypothetical protein
LRLLGRDDHPLSFALLQKKSEIRNPKSEIKQGLTQNREAKEALVESQSLGSEVKKSFRGIPPSPTSMAERRANSFRNAAKPLRAWRGAPFLISNATMLEPRWSTPLSFVELMSMSKANATTPDSNGV